MMRPRSVQDFTLDSPIRSEPRDAIDHWSEAMRQSTAESADKLVATMCNWCAGVTNV